MFDDRKYNHLWNEDIQEYKSLVFQKIEPSLYKDLKQNFPGTSEWLNLT